MKTGDVVTLKSGGVNMTVMGFECWGDGIMARVAWTNDAGNYYHEVFPIEALEWVK